LIEVDVFEGRITVKGHAGYADKGKDIVCAAVSALFQTLIGSMEKITEDSIKYCLVPGESFLKYEELSYESRIMLDSFFIGIRSLADEYPEYVKIT